MKRIHPLAALVYFVGVSAVVMLSLNPVLLILSLAGSIGMFCTMEKRGTIAEHVFVLGLFCAMSVLNPIFSHNGATVLFVLNDNPVTLEAFLYGMASATMIVSVLYWFRSMTQILSADKLMYLFGRFSPKLALLLSMTLRYVPLFSGQAKRVRCAQKGLGLFKEENAIDGIRGNARVFSILVTWALENGIITADSMAARGYGIGRRTSFAMYRFRRADGIFLCATLVLTAGALWSVFGGNSEFAYYPHIAAPNLRDAIWGYVCYGVLTIFPILTEGVERLKWRCLLSKI